jgi:hypothetical protein
MGADGAATLGTILGQGTVLQPVKKLQKIANKMILGVSGPMGLGQRISGIVEQLLSTHKLNGVSSVQAMQIIRQNVAQILMPEIKYATEAVQLTGGASRQAALSQTVMALPVENKLRLYCLGCTGEPEEMTEHLPFVAIGSAQNLADPFLAFLRSVFWKNSGPNIAEGMFATSWSLRHAIRRNTGGVSDPIQMMTLQEPQRGTFVIKELDSLELQEMEEAITAAEKHLSQFQHDRGEAPPTSG